MDIKKIATRIAELVDEPPKKDDKPNLPVYKSRLEKNKPVDKKIEIKKPEEPGESEEADESKKLDNILEPSTEYSVQLELSLIADFEGDTSKSKLLNLLKKELVASVRSSMSTVAKELKLKPIKAVIKPLKIECAINDQSGIGK